MLCRISFYEHLTGTSVREVDLKLLASSLAVQCLVSKVVCQETCPPVVEYMWSFGEYCPVCPVTLFIAGKIPVSIRIRDVFVQ